MNELTSGRKPAEPCSVPSMTPSAGFSMGTIRPVPGLRRADARCLFPHVQSTARTGTMWAWCETCRITRICRASGGEGAFPDPYRIWTSMNSPSGNRQRRALPSRAQPAVGSWGDRIATLVLASGPLDGLPSARARRHSAVPVQTH